MIDPSLPCAFRLLAMVVPPRDREEYLGDLAEELHRRRTRDPQEANLWVVREVWAGGAAWLRWRWSGASPRSDGWAAVVSFGCILALLGAANTEPVLEGVRQLTPGGRATAAIGINVGALFAAGAVSGLVAGRLSWRALGGLLTLVVVYIATASGGGWPTHVPTMASVAWVGAACVSVITGAGSFEWLRARPSR